MSVAVSIVHKLLAIETLETGVPAAAAADKTVTHSGFDRTFTLNSATTPPATKCAYFSQALSTGAATIDLTALPGVNGGTVNGTGLKVQAIRFENPAANANAITIGEGASNGYELLGNAWTVPLQPGQIAQYYLKDLSPDISGSAKTMDLTGTGSQTLNVSLVLG
jgi:hypothetical protein